MDSEVAHAAVLAVESGDALPVDRLRRVEVATVEKQRPHLDRAPETALADEPRHLLAAGKERQLGRAPNEKVGMLPDLGVDGGVRREVDPERLLAEQVLPGPKTGDVDLLVEVVRHCDVDGVDRFVREHLPVVGHKARPRVETLVPGKNLGVRVTHGDDARPRADRLQVDPSGTGARELAAHEPATDHAERDSPLSHGGDRAPGPPRLRRGRLPSATWSSPRGRRAG